MDYSMTMLDKNYTKKELEKVIYDGLKTKPGAWPLYRITNEKVEFLCTRCKKYLPLKFIRKDGRKLRYMCNKCAYQVGKKYHGYLIKGQSAVGKAVEKGLLPRITSQTCANCGKPAAHYHHHKGYAKENLLDVIPLCAKCHANVHVTFIPPKGGETP
jgi:DNA-directed RNA polymerase subunit RPC12/RpoP